MYPAVIGLVDGCYVLRGAGADESIADVVPVMGRLMITGRDITDISSPLTPEESRYETILVGEDRNAIPFHAWSPNGAYLAFMPTNPLAIHVVDVRSPPVYQRDAVLLPNANAFWDEGSWSNPYAWSPDSTRILYKRCGAIRAVNPFTWQYDVLVQDSSVAGNAYQPLWSPDGEHIVFLVKSRGDFSILQRLSDSAFRRSYCSADG